jgi:hypothetical protein
MKRENVPGALLSKVKNINMNSLGAVEEPVTSFDQ